MRGAEACVSSLLVYGSILGLQDLRNGERIGVVCPRTLPYLERRVRETTGA